MLFHCKNLFFEEVFFDGSPGRKPYLVAAPRRFMKYAFLLISIIGLCMMLFNHTLAFAGNMKMEHHEEKQIEEHEDDLDFESTEFAETASYQIVSPSNKGFFIAVLFTGSMWGMFIFLFFNMKKGSGSIP